MSPLANARDGLPSLEAWITTGGICGIVCTMGSRLPIAHLQISSETCRGSTSIRLATTQMAMLADPSSKALRRRGMARALELIPLHQAEVECSSAPASYWIARSSECARIDRLIAVSKAEWSNARADLFFGPRVYNRRVTPNFCFITHPLLTTYSR